MSFREDESRIRTDHGPQNMAALRHIALNLIKLDKDRKVGVKASTKRDGWNESCVEVYVKCDCSGYFYCRYLTIAGAVS
jgi:hypothetical protein